MESLPAMTAAPQGKVSTASLLPCTPPQAAVSSRENPQQPDPGKEGHTCACSSEGTKVKSERPAVHCEEGQQKQQLSAVVWPV